MDPVRLRVPAKAESVSTFRVLDAKKKWFEWVMTRTPRGPNVRAYQPVESHAETVFSVGLWTSAGPRWVVQTEEGTSEERIIGILSLIRVKNDGKQKGRGPAGGSARVSLLYSTILPPSALPVLRNYPVAVCTMRKVATYTAHRSTKIKNIRLLNKDVSENRLRFRPRDFHISH